MYEAIKEIVVIIFYGVNHTQVVCMCVSECVLCVCVHKGVNTDVC